MFGGGENNVNTSARNINNKDTLHISPHIAAHKSSNSSHSTAQSNIDNSQEQGNQNLTRSLQTLSGHVPPGYRVGIPTSTIFSEPFQHNVRTQSTHIQVPTIFALPSSKALPQDLSSHNKLTLSDSDTAMCQKPLPHIQTVGGQTLDNITGSLIVPVSDRSPTYYRLADGTTLTISSQHQAVLMSPQNESQSSIHHSHLDSGRQSQHSEGNSSTSVSASMPMATLAGSVNSHQHGSVAGIPEGHLYLVPHEISNGNGGFLSPDSVLPDRDIRTPHIEEVKEEDPGEHKDLVRQALQAAVVHNSHKMNTNHDVIDYNYGTENIGGSDDCLVHEDIICHSTFCSQPNVKPQELLLMNINVNPVHQTQNKVNCSVVMGSNANENSSGSQAVVLDPAANIDESGNIINPIILTSRRRRTRLSEEAQALRREKIANRMREKRANETEEQKEKRRLREAERMRKKRAQEDETSKERRRREAAERARLRRAKLSNEERELERKKAAARMRLRRQNENEEQKRLRRIKAAERMRKRRSTETPEERALRKLNIAMRMKAKRQKKDDKLNLQIKSEISVNSMSSREIFIEKETVVTSESDGQQYTSSEGHTMVSQSLSNVSGNLSLLQHDSLHTNSNNILPGSVIPSVDLVHVSQTGPLQGRNSSPPLMQQRSPNESDERPPMSFHKSGLVSQDNLSTHIRDSDKEERQEDNSSPSNLSKNASLPHLSSHHHLPHLLHQLTPHQDQHHHHQSYMLPHQTQHTHQQNQPLQLRHQ